MRVTSIMTPTNTVAMRVVLCIMFPLTAAMIPIAEVAENGLTVQQAEFYLSQSQPFIIRGGAAHWPAMRYKHLDPSLAKGRIALTYLVLHRWNLDKIGRECRNAPLQSPCTGGAMRVTRRLGSVAGTETSGFQSIEAVSVPPAELSSLRDLPELLHAIARPSSNASTALMLFDMSIQRACPTLVRDIRIPRYMPIDFMSLLPTAQKSSCAQDGTHQWPALFVAPNGTSTPLHVDTSQMRFWMAVLKGSKRWSLWPPHTLDTLHPTDDPIFPTRFAPGRSGPAHAEHAFEARWEGVVGAGDVIVVPQGWAHQVTNIGLTIALAFNFVDRFGFQEHVGGVAMDAVTTRDAAQRNASIALLQAYRSHRFATRSAPDFRPTPCRGLDGHPRDFYFEEFRRWHRDMGAFLLERDSGGAASGSATQGGACRRPAPRYCSDPG